MTRPAAQAVEWVERLRGRGWQAEALPLIGIAGAPDPQAVQAAWARLHGCRAVVFVSPNAADRFFAARPPDQAWPAGVLAATPGPGTDAALHAAGVPPELRVQPAPDAAQFDSESLWQQLRGRDWTGGRVLIVRGDGGREWLAERLREAGAEVDFVCAYRREAPRLDAAQDRLLRAAIAEPHRHLWFFSSSEAVDHLQACCQERGLQPAWHDSHALATHPRIAARAAALGCGQVVEVQPSLEAVSAGIERSIQSLAP
ncbi:uroporphyrinogen-III synthase [Eleftheria terrae]|uniref:uroporphyrinogen-III synthase n=1 Tax=Eleftheria terrae TaxID=1597781 RepID=UPI003F4E2709